jgi:hypothetical protein
MGDLQAWRFDGLEALESSKKKLMKKWEVYQVYH